MTAYAGKELPLFASATNWKRYWMEALRPHIRGHVLEVGAGLGANTRLLLEAAAHVTQLEPDAELAAQLRAARLDAVEVVEGDLTAIDPGRGFDTIVYLDVLEHIRDDKAEVARAVERLAPGGKLVVMAPAHPMLYSPFDAAIGHHRRYTRRALVDLTADRTSIVALFQLDCVGMALSFANRVLLRSASPSMTAIAVWDRCAVPLSRLIDPLMGRRLGRSIVCAWQK